MFVLFHSSNINYWQRRAYYPKTRTTPVLWIFNQKFISPRLRVEFGSCHSLGVAGWFVRLWHVPNGVGNSEENLLKKCEGSVVLLLVCLRFNFFKVHVVPKRFTCQCGKSYLKLSVFFWNTILSGPYCYQHSNIRNS